MAQTWHLNVSRPLALGALPSRCSRFACTAARLNAARRTGTDAAWKNRLTPTDRPIVTIFVQRTMPQKRPPRNAYPASADPDGELPGPQMDAGRAGKGMRGCETR